MLPEIFGFVGMSLILFSFIMNQAKRWKEDYLVYDIFNALGSLGMVYYAYTLSSWPFLILNGIWAAVSLKDVFVGLRKK